jgi:hypothetical protein
VAARLHPWCNLWADETGHPVCQAGATNLPNVPRCNALARRHFEARSVLTCASRAVPDWCHSDKLLGNGPQYPFTAEYSGLADYFENRTAVMPYCE